MMGTSVSFYEDLKVLLQWGQEESYQQQQQQWRQESDGDGAEAQAGEQAVSNTQTGALEDDDQQQQHVEEGLEQGQAAAEAAQEDSKGDAEAAGGTLGEGTGHAAKADELLGGAPEPGSSSSSSSSLIPEELLVVAALHKAGAVKELKVPVFGGIHGPPLKLQIFRKGRREDVDLQ